MSLAKSSFLVASWIAGYFNIHYMPADLMVLNMGSIFLTAKALCYGICTGYTIWLLWHDQLKIYLVLEAVGFTTREALRNWHYRKTN